MSVYTTTMQVINRLNIQEEMSFDEIKNRIKSLINYSDEYSQILDNVSPFLISMETMSKLFDGISTIELDIESAKVCASKEIIHYNYGYLGGRILVSNHHKNLKILNLNSFYERTKFINDNLDNFYNTDYYNFVLNHKDELENIINQNRDYMLSYFGFKTLERSYLFKVKDKIIETPQDLFLRVAIAIHFRDSNYNQFNLIKETYNVMSLGFMTHATPTLFNAGTKFEQMSSCYLLGTDDSLDNIFKTISDCAQISKWSGGIGVHISNIRSQGSVIKSTNGKSDGIIPMIKVYNEVARYVNQCFVPETIVFSKEGPKMMKDITTNDKLVTIDGSYKKVNEIITNEIIKEILEIKTSFSNNYVKVTKEHEIYIIKNTNELSIEEIHNLLKDESIKPEFISANELTINDLVCFPIPTDEIDYDIFDYNYCKYYGIVLNNGFKINKNDINKEFIISYLDERNLKFNEEGENIVWDDVFTFIDTISNKILNLPKSKLSIILENINLKPISPIIDIQLKYIQLKLGILNTNKYFEHNNLIWCKIDNINNINYNGTVYDFNMDDNHNYLTEIGLVHNSGKRKGSIAIYLEPWHADIESFIDLKKNTGAETERARDIFTALWIPDIFMEKVLKNEDWYLMCPSECPNLTETYGEEFNNHYNKYINENKYKKKINSQDLFNKIMDSQIETGVPYILYKDNINRKNNQSNIGIIKSSNLCVHEDTKILTKFGYYNIKSLMNREVDIWNGKEWSKVIVNKTGSNKDLLRIICSNGSVLDCTPEHKFYISENYYKSAGELKVGDKLISYKLPDKLEFYNDNFKYPYTHGLYCGSDTFNNNKNKLSLFDDKKKLLIYIQDEYSYNNNHKLWYNETEYSYDVELYDIAEKFFVPENYTINIRLRWLEGYTDSDGIMKNDGLYFTHYDKNFLTKIRYMLHTLGIESEIKYDKTERDLLDKCNRIYYNLIIDKMNLYKLSLIDYNPKHVIIQFDSCLYQPLNNYIVSVSESFKNVDTYCFSEPKRNMGMFNGILTGQCAEIVEVSTTEEYGTCNLASIAVNKFINLEKIKEVNLNDKETLLENFKIVYNFDKLLEVSKIATYNLNKIIDYNFYPVEETKKSNMKNRPIGIGVQGLGDLYYILELQYNSYASKLIDSLIMETIYYAAIYQSSDLSKINGSYFRYSGSPYSKGILHFDLVINENKFDFKNLYPQMYDWNILKEKVKNDGMYNSLLTALMPTASSSNIYSNNECFEPYSSNIFKRTTLAGEFQIVNKHLIKKLIELNIWNDETRNNIINNDGSVRNLNIDDNLKEIFKTIWEIKQKDILDHALARSPYVDQSQSMNLFFANPNYRNLFSALVYGWEKGLKTGCYYLRSKPAVEAKKITYQCTVCSS